MSYYSRDCISLERASQMIPALVSEPHHSRSARYEHIPTISILRALEKEGFSIHGLTTAKVRNGDRNGFQKHLVRLRRPEHAARDEAPEVVLINSHDGSSSYQLLCGMIRFACANGLIVGDTWSNVRVKHTGKDLIGQVIEGTYSVVENFDRLAGRVDEMKAITLAPAEQEAFAEAAMSLRYSDENPSPISAPRLLMARRKEDVRADLWTVFNRIQENIIKGGQRGIIHEPGKVPRNASVRAVNGIDGNVKLNQALFTLAESMAKLKAA